MFNCKIYHDIGENTCMTLHNQDYISLKDIAIVSHGGIKNNLNNIIRELRQ